MSIMQEVGLFVGVYMCDFLWILHSEGLRALKEQRFNSIIPSEPIVLFSFQLESYFTFEF